MFKALQKHWTINCVILSSSIGARVGALCNTFTLSSARHYANTFIKAIGALWLGDPERRARHSRSSGTCSASRRERAAVDIRYCGDPDLVVRRVLARGAGDRTIATDDRLPLLRAEVLDISFRKTIAYNP